MEIIDNPALTFGYTNHRGEYAVRQAIPLRAEYRVSEHHGDQPHHLLICWDVEKQAERDFKIEDMIPGAWLRGEKQHKHALRVVEHYLDWCHVDETEWDAVSEEAGPVEHATRRRKAADVLFQALGLVGMRLDDKFGEKVFALLRKHNFVGLGSIPEKSEVEPTIKSGDWVEGFFDSTGKFTVTKHIPADSQRILREMLGIDPAPKLTGTDIEAALRRLHGEHGFYMQGAEDELPAELGGGYVRIDGSIDLDRLAEIMLADSPRNATPERVQELLETNSRLHNEKVEARRLVGAVVLLANTWRTHGNELVSDILNGVLNGEIDARSDMVRHSAPGAARCVGPIEEGLREIGFAHSLEDAARIASSLLEHNFPNPDAPAAEPQAEPPRKPGKYGDTYVGAIFEHGEFVRFMTDEEYALFPKAEPAPRNHREDGEFGEGATVNG